jgi:putative ABC transport system permease protein
MIRQDLVYALRVLRKRPAFALIAILTLALGIGANTTIFSLIDAVLLRPLPYPHPDRLLSLWASYPASQGQPDIFSAPNYLDLAAQTKTLEAVGSWDNANFTLAGAGDPESIAGLRLTASMARVLDIAPRIGRWFTPQEDDSGQPVVLLSDAVWRARFAADPRVLGRTLQLNGRPSTILGVLPPATGFPSITTALYVPMSFTADDRAGRGSVEFNAAARMKPHVALVSVEAELRTISASLAREYPVNQGMQMGAIPLADTLVGNVRRLLIVLWAAVAFMLAVGCANVANLLLTHAAGRQREFAVRRSLGASDARLVRQLLTESLLLASAGGVVGLAIAMASVPFMAAQLPRTFPHLNEVGLEPSVLLFTLAVSLVTGLLFGLAPAIGTARRNLAAAIREGEGRTGRSVAYRRLGRGLVVGEVAVVLVLLVGAGLVLRSLVALSGVDPGFRSRRLVAWQLFLPPTRYSGTGAQRAFYRRVVDQAASLPGVQSAALANPLPFGPVDITIDGGFRIAGQPDPGPGQVPQALFTRVSPGYFATMGIPLERGRDFTAHDDDTAPAVAIVSETLARRYFPRQDAVGRRIILGRRQPIELEIIGVAGDVKHNNLRSDIRPELYIPLARFTPGIAGLLVRGSGDSRSLVPALQRRVWSIDSRLAANLAVPVDDLLYASLAPSRIAATLLAVFAATTLMLGLAGIYGVLSYAISQRTREIGIRLALGAAPADLMRMVLGEALGLAAGGVALGLAAAPGLTRYLNSLLFGVQASDQVTYLIAAAGIPAAALAAAWAPARRAMRVDPATSLKAD